MRWLRPIVKGIRIPKCEKFLLFGIRNPGKFRLRNLESWALEYGVKPVQGIWNPSNEWNPESTFHWQRLGSSTWYPQFTTWNPESNTVLDSLSWDEWISTFIILRKCEDTYLVQNPKRSFPALFLAWVQKWLLGSISVSYTHLTLPTSDLV